MAEKKVEKCARPGCECPAAKGSKYCSPYCECVPIDHLPDACECGHTECAAGATAGAAGWLHRESTTISPSMPTGMPTTCMELSAWSCDPECYAPQAN
jgi:hypothetical protein